MNDNFDINNVDRFEKTIDNMIIRFSTVRAGRANASSLDGVVVNYYGVMTPLKQLTTISIPESRQLLIKPFDKSCLSAIEKAIYEASLGYAPNNDGETIRIIIPELTEERRQELTKQIKSMAEESKIALRNIRHDMLGELKNLNLSEDDQKRNEDLLQNNIAKYNKKIDDLVKEKEAELLNI